MRLYQLLLIFFLLLSSFTFSAQGEVIIEGQLSISEVDTANYSPTAIARQSDGVVAAALVKESIVAESPSPLPYNSGWADYNDSYQGGTFYKYGNRVHFDGLIEKKSGSIVFGDTICVLPQGYRPDRRMIVHAKQDATPMRLNIEPDGVIWVVDNGGTWVDITGISFYKNEIEIGDFIEGGIVFYVANPAEDLDGDGDLDRGMVINTADLGGYFWGCPTTSINNTTKPIGTGKTNTENIVNACGSNIAASVCDELILNGYSDWFLPSLQELKEAHKHLGQGSNIGNFSSIYYWSSSERSFNAAFINSISTPFDELDLSNKSTTVSKLRAVRVF